MKNAILSLSLFLSFSTLVHAQWTTSGTITSTTNSIGIGTTMPQSLLHISGTGTFINQSSQFDPKSLIIQSNNGGRGLANGAQLEFVIPANTDGTNPWGQARIITVAGNSNTGDATGKMIFGTRRMFNKVGAGATWYYGDDVTIDGRGNVGIGITNPQTNLHVVGIGTDKDGDNSRPLVGGGLTIQGNTGQRSTTSGAQLEFAIPTNVNNAGMWGQARIIAVNGTANNGEVRGKMILGTRRNFDKLGTGAQYYYGDDLVIDQAGNVGIGTTNPREALSVNGNIRSKQVTVELANWPDYVFKKGYQLPSLQEVKAYIDQNQHLPGIPSEQQITKEGLNLGEMNKLLMKKVEELTLYLIEKDQKERKQIETNDILEAKLKQQQTEIDALKVQMKNLIKP